MARILNGGYLSGSETLTGNDLNDPGYLNLQYGGHYGYTHRIGHRAEDGRHYEEWMNSAQYVQQDLIPVLLSYPKAMDALSKSKDQFIANLKALIEVRSKTIDGFTAKLTVNTQEQQIGSSGAEYQEDPVGVRVERSQPTHTFPEVLGEGVRRFWDYYVRWLVRDPDTRVMRAANFYSDLDRPKAWTPDLYTFSVIYIEPDPQHRRCQKAWLGLGLFPKTAGECTGKKDTLNDQEVKEHSIEFAGTILPPSEPLRAFGDRILQTLTILRNKNPDDIMALPLEGKDPQLDAYPMAGYNREM